MSTTIKTPALQLTRNEALAIRDCWCSSANNGHDFGIGDELPSIPAKARGALVASLAKKGLIVVHPGEGGHPAQFTFTDQGKTLFADFDGGPDLKENVIMGATTTKDKAPGKGRAKATPSANGKADKAHKASPKGEGKGSRERGLGVAMLATLQALVGATKGLTHAEIAKSTGRDTGNRLRELTEKGFVVTEKHHEDLRCHLFKITAAGKEAYRKATK